MIRSYNEREFLHLNKIKEFLIQYATILSSVIPTEIVENLLLYYPHATAEWDFGSNLAEPQQIFPVNCLDKQSNFSFRGNSYRI